VSFDSFPDDYLRELKEKYGTRRAGEYEQEHEKVQSYFEAVRNRLEGTYAINEVLAVGGTGIVHRGIHERFDQPVIVKINPNRDVDRFETPVQEYKRRIAEGASCNTDREKIEDLVFIAAAN
jgi:hypothetical protein